MEWRDSLSAHTKMNTIQIASGLAIHSIKKCNFSDVLKPAARTLILAGDILKAGDPVNGKFAKYLLDNWSRIFYINGCSERMGRFTPLGDYYQRLVTFQSNGCSPFGKTPNGKLISFVAAPQIPWDLEATRLAEQHYVEETLDWHPGKFVVASSGYLPKQLQLHDKVCVAVQGIAERNQFDPALGAVTNSRTNPNGTRRRSYRNDFVLELR
jgi:hypothetical protein